MKKNKVNFVLLLLICFYHVAQVYGENRMKQISFDYAQTSLVAADELQIAQEKLKDEIDRIDQAQRQGYETDYASINLSKDKALITQVMQVVKEKKSLQPTALVVIGIGGSNLGTIAVHEALYGKHYNEQDPDIKVYFADTVDTDSLYDIVLLVQQEMEKGHNIILNVISKSGTTTETIANFELFLELLKRYRPYNYNNFVVATTDEGSKLWQFAQQEEFTCLPIPVNVGGRYSVLSAVSLLPLCFLGVDIQALHEGAASIMPTCLDKDIFQNSAALSAAILTMQYKKGCVIHDTFIFSPDLESIGKWYRQLMGESIGKAYNRAGQKVNVGITPTVSVGSIDLHSVAQLYLGGPYDKFTTFISVEKNKSDVVVPEFSEFEVLVPKIQGKQVNMIMNAILQGTKAAYRFDNRPFVSITVPEKSEYYIGQLLQCKMMEMMYLGYLLDVNPFDQPQVELYKKETKKILAQ